jgi:hypothetical protein
MIIRCGLPVSRQAASRKAGRTGASPVMQKWKTLSHWAGRAWKLLLLPVWLIQILSTAKSFRDNPVIGNPMLNRLGLHVFRVRLAHAVMRLRWWMLAPLVSERQRREFLSDGFLVVRNFLPAEHFKQLREELKTSQAPVRECIQGDTLTLRVLLDASALRGLPACRALLRRRDFLNLTRFCAGTLRTPMFFIQSVKNAYVPGAADPQKTLHSDTFHPTMKAWLFVDDVEESQGPFTYVPGSHLPSPGRLAWEYEQSVGCSRHANRYSAKGSLRLDPADLPAMGLPQPIALAVPANTLVVANTHGFHCRGIAIGKCSRLEIYASSRTNPFVPIPGFLTSLFGRVEHIGAQGYWHVMDWIAARRGAQSSWHLVPSRKLHD